MTILETEALLHAFIRESFYDDDNDHELDRDSDLFQTFDSLQILRIVLHIEHNFGVVVTDADLTAENLGSIGKAARFVEGKLFQANTGVQCASVEALLPEPQQCP